MVARSGPTTDRHSSARSGLLGGLFHAWRVLLTRAIRAVAQALRITVTMLSGNALAEGVPTRATVWAAVGALLIGIAVATATRAVDRGTVPGLAAALVSAMWTAARLVVMRVRGAERVATVRETTVAWAAGALFFAIAATPLLRIVAWLAGALTSYRTLRSGAAQPADARSIVVWGYGVEAIGLIAVWLLGSLAILAYL